MATLTTRGRRVATAIGFVFAAALVVAFGLALRSWGAPSTPKAVRAYDRGDWASAEAEAARVLALEPDDAEALRVRARSLARLGRPDEALALDARLGGGRLQAEDLVLAGRSLIEGGRPALGWAALDAASKLDPGHPGAAEALAGRSRQAPADARADRLSAVPDGPALAELVVHLASLDRPAGASPGPLLEAVLRRERPAFLGLAAPADARKLVARALLEQGRAGEALDRLAPADDPEALWLRGRARLALGDLAGANEATAKAGGFGLDDPAAPEPSRYVGARQCESCHAEVYESQQSSRHSATVAWGPALAKVPLPAGPVVDPEVPAVTHRFERQGDRIEVASGEAGRAAVALIDYALGSGHHGVTMLAREADGKHRSLRISYYAGGDHWGLTSGFEPRPADPKAYLGEPMGEEGFRSCLNCHTTRFTREDDRRGPEAADRGIGCERCHGPGELHVRAVEAGFSQPAIARPRLATPARRLKLCAQCHASDGVIPPADPRFIRFQALTLPRSRCVSESGGRLDCVACHDPHADLETSPAYYEARCLACHDRAGGGAGRPAGPKVRVEAVAASPCPVNPKGGCLPCHMPKVPEIMPFMSFTDHHIRVRPPEGAAATAATAGKGAGR